MPVCRFGIVLCPDERVAFWPSHVRVHCLCGGIQECIRAARFLKHPIFMEHNLIALASPALVGINCGVVYSHNAHPAGPTAWAAYQVPDRTLRWLDDQEYILDKLKATGKQHKLQDIGFEQSVYNDAVWSIVSGKPVFAHSLRPDYDPSQMGNWEHFHKSIGPERKQRMTVCSLLWRRAHV